MVRTTLVAYYNRFFCFQRRREKTCIGREIKKIVLEIINARKYVVTERQRFKDFRFHLITFDVQSKK